MAPGTTAALCLLLVAVCSGLILERLPRHIPSHKNRFAQDSQEDEDLATSFDSSVEKRKISQDPNQLAPLIIKPTWKAIYPFSQEGHIFSGHKKRAIEQSTKEENMETSEKDRHELVDILKDDDQDNKEQIDDESKHSNEKKEKSVNKHTKIKRQSSEEAEKNPEISELAETGEHEETPQTPDFQDWLRREYYRNMAKSFASMRKKRDGSSAMHDSSEHSKSRPKREKKSPKKSISFEEVTDNLRAIEDVLFLDALQTIREAGDDYEEDAQKQRRITNDLSSAYDLETMRNALFRLRDTLGNMEQESSVQEEERYRPAKKRGGDQCPPLELLTSDCSSLGDIVPDGPLKRLLLHACNWHEVCYTCGEVFGLTSENCDVGFIEQSQTICRGDIPCESTASLLLLPLRQRRVFYKRSNPSVCLVDTCVEDFLRQV